MMTDDEYRSLAKRCLGLALRRPRLYRFGVFLAATAAAVVYILFMIGLAVCLVISLIAILVVLYFRGRIAHTQITTLLGPLIQGILSMMRGLWVRYEPPDGIQVNLGDYPQLKQELAEIAGAVGTRLPHVVMVTSDFNAAAMQAPRFGIFAGHRRYLFLGMPLLDSIAPEEARAVIAHELAHLSCNHGLQHRWINFVGSAWHQAVVAIYSAGQSPGLLGTLFSWQEPRFRARRAMLSQLQEFEADRISAQATSRNFTARALVRIEVAAPLWAAALLQRARTEVLSHPEPPTDLFERISTAEPEDSTVEALRKQLASMLNERDSVGDHPSLSSRLEALGVPTDAEGYLAELLSRPSPCASAVLFGEGATDLRRRVGTRWNAEISDRWNAWYHATNEKFAEKAGIEEKPAAGRTPKEKWRLIHQSIEHDEPSIHEAKLRDLLAEAPDQEETIMELAILAAERDDPEFVSLIGRLHAGHSSSAVSQAAQLAEDFIVRNSAMVDSVAIRKRLATLCASVEERDRRRFSFDLTRPSLRPHSLKEWQVRQLASRLSALPISKAWLLEKDSEPDDGIVLVLVIIQKWTLTELDRNASFARLIERIGALDIMPYGYIAVQDDSGGGRVLAAAKRTPGSQLLPLKK